jgi:hypothetical protein
LRASFAPYYTYAAALARASFALADKNEFRVFSYGTCWGFRSPIPRSTLRLSPRFLPSAVTVFDFPIKRKMFISRIIQNFILMIQGQMLSKKV